MRLLAFAKRTFLEIIRDPLTVFFGVGFPVVLLLVLSAIQANIPVSLFEIDQLAPGMTVFGLSFMTLFSASLIAKDRESAFLQRLYLSPMTALEFILGYTLPLLLLAFLQSTICYVVGLCLGLTPTWNILLALLFILLIALFFIGLGLLFGSLLTQKQTGGICGALLTNLTAFLSGIWFDLELVGGIFAKIDNCLPFLHAVRLEQLVYAGGFGEMWHHLLWVAVYAIAIIFLAVYFFLKQMRSK